MPLDADYYRPPETRLPKNDRIKHTGSMFLSHFLKVTATVLILFSVGTAQAAKILNIKSGLTLLDLEGSTPQKGDYYLVTDTAGKRRALLQISQLKDSKAIAHIVKGNLTAAPETYSLSVYTPPNKTADAAKPAEKTSPAKKSAHNKDHVPHSWGALAGLAENNMKVTLAGSSAVNMKGSSYSFEGFYQQPLDGRVEVLGRFGYDTLSVKGTANSTTVCGDGHCNVDIGYLGFDGLVRYAFRQPRFAPWIGGGLGFLFAMNKKSNVLDTSKISTNQTFLAAAGVDWNIDRRTFIPFQIDYALWTNKNTVTTNQMIFRIGYGVRY